MRQTKYDDRQWDVLTCVCISAEKRLQWKEIRDILHKKYPQYDKESFEVILTRALNSLIKSGDLHKDNKSHQEVYYYIPKRRHQKIIDGVSKRFLYRKVDEFWERFSLEQKKRAVKDLATSQAMMGQVYNYFLKELFSLFGGWANDIIADLNDPIQQKGIIRTTEEKVLINKELTKLKNDLDIMKSNIAEEQKFVSENFNALIEMSFDFLNYVVDPLYGGNGQMAIQDLMRKAIEEQKNKNNKEISGEQASCF